MRFREPFCLYKRDISKNRSVWYYKTYDEKGHRTCGHSTGLTSKTQARNYCMELYRKGTLVPKKHQKTDRQLFKDYAKDWWIHGKCQYIKARIARGGSFSKGYAHHKRHCLVKHILPAFGHLQLNEITAARVEKWLLEFIEGGRSNTTANHNLETIRVMMKEAYRLGLIPQNPLEQVLPLKRNTLERGILSMEEFTTLFSPVARNKHWCNDQVFLMNLLSACTAMRLGEVIALHCEDLMGDYVHVHRSYDQNFGLKDTKTHDKRDIPLPDFLIKELNKLKDERKTGFLFLGRGGTAVYHRTVSRGLYDALDSALEMDSEKRRKRNITFHSWRHFFNSTMRSNNIADSKVQKITGHKTDAMTEHYTHFNVDDFKEVKNLQENILNFTETA